MRITCPNCTAHFDIPNELLGKKGRALKCASCTHSWFQTAAVESMELAAIMGEEYAAQARASGGAVQRAAGGAPQPAGAAAASLQPAAVAIQRTAGAAVQMRSAPSPAAPGAGPRLQVVPGSAGSVPGAGAPMPPGAVSLMNREQAARGGPQPPVQSLVQRNQAPGAQPQMAPLGVPGAPRPAGVGAPLPGVSIRGQVGAGAVGQSAVSWVQPHPPPGAVPGASGGAPGNQAQAPKQGRPMPPGVQGAPVMPGAPGQGAVSWLQPPAGAAGAPGGRQAAPGQPMPGQPVPGRPMPAGVPGGPVAVALGQSVRGQVGPAPAGQAAVSIRQDAAHAAPGAPAVSLLTGQVAVPGQAATSIRDGATHAAPGAPAVSLMSGEIVAPGQGSHSLIDGKVQAGQPGQSMAAPAATGNAAQPPAPGQAPGAAGAAANGGTAKPEAELKAGEAKAAKEDPKLVAGESKPKKEDPKLVAGETKTPKEDPKIVAGETKTPKEDPKLVAGESKPKKDDPAGAAGEDDELVDPNADRPNFGTATDEADELSSEDAADDAFASVAARAGGGEAKAKRDRKPVDPAYLTVAIMGLAVVSLAGMVWLGRGIMLEIWPGIAGFYESVGIEAAKPGDGLRLAESSKSLRRINGIETLVVQGFISNISDVPRTVPNLRLELYDAKVAVIQDSSLKAPIGLLDPGATVDFEIRLELPQLNMATGGYAVVWEQ